MNINSRNSNNESQTNACLINLNAYGSGGATGVYLGNVASTIGNGSGNLVFGRRTGSHSWVETMRINKNGNVGIGTTSPSSKLHIKDTNDGDLIRLEGSGNYKGVLRFGSTFSDFPSGELGNDAIPTNAGGLILQCSGPDWEGAALWLNGQSAGVVSPGDNQTWSWRDEDGYSSGYTWYITTSGSITTGSDIRLKENIRYFNDEYDISKIREKYSQIKFCKYNWKKAFKGTSVKQDFYGIIAQELEILFPDMIEMYGNTDRRMLNQERLKYISYYIIQDLIVENGKLSSQLDSQANTIQQQATKNSELENEVATLKSELAAIKQHLGI